MAYSPELVLEAIQSQYRCDAFLVMISPSKNVFEVGTFRM